MNLESIKALAGTMIGAPVVAVFAGVIAVSDANPAWISWHHVLIGFFLAGPTAVAAFVLGIWVGLRKFEKLANEIATREIRALMNSTAESYARFEQDGVTAARQANSAAHQAWKLAHEIEVRVQTLEVMLREKDIDNGGDVT